MEATLQSPFGQTVLEPGVVTIGSTLDSRVVVHDAKVSPHHAVVRSTEQGYTITDWGSSEGTFVNEQRLEPRVPRLLTAGDRIRIGETVFTYEVHEGPALVQAKGSPSHDEPVTLLEPSEHTIYGPDAEASSALAAQTLYGPGLQQLIQAPSQQPAVPMDMKVEPEPLPGEVVSPGKPVTHHCPQCHAELPAGARFCGNCGFPGASEAGPGEAASTNRVSALTHTPSEQPDAPPAPPRAIPVYGVAPPPLPPYTPLSPRKKPGGWLKITLIAVAVLFVLAGVGVGAFFLLQPQPVISVTSDYKIGSTPAGAIGTVFHVSGRQFSSNSTITFLLDGTPISGERLVQSDANGNVKTDLAVTSNWAVGHHSLTARDAGSHVTKTGMTVVIVPQGQAHTPGPNGAPPDDKSFTIGVTEQRSDTVTGQQLQPWNTTLIITGHPDGGSVQQPQDDGQPHTLTGSYYGGTYTDTYVFQSSGTYKGGQLSYTETYVSDKWSFSSGLTCESNSPSVAERLEGTFSDQNTISGTVSNDAISIPCSGGATLSINGATGTWTGTLEQGATTSVITSHIPVGLEAIWTKPLAWA